MVHVCYQTKQTLQSKDRIPLHLWHVSTDHFLTPNKMVIPKGRYTRED